MTTLIGILESKNPLQQRIEQLMSFRPLRKAELTMAFALCVSTFAVLSAPTETPPPTENQVSTGAQVTLPAVSSAAQLSTNTNKGKIEANTLVKDGRLLLELGKLDEAAIKLNRAIGIDLGNKAARYYLSLVKEARDRRTYGTGSPTRGRQEISTKLQRIRLDSVTYERVTLGEVARHLSEESRKRDPDKRGVHFMIRVNTSTIDTNTGLPEVSSVAGLPISLNPPMTDVSLEEVLDMLVKVSPKPFHYSIEDYGVVFLPGKARYYLDRVHDAQY